MRFSGGSQLHARFVRERDRFIPQVRALLFKIDYEDVLAPVAVFEGGTGTGKSTIFNSLLGFPVSRTGVRRPQTLNPIILLPRRMETVFQEADLFPDVLCRWRNLMQAPQDKDEQPQDLLFILHDFAAWQDMILVDSPDVDSVVSTNRTMAEDLYGLADLVVFVTSQEKYADRLPFEWIKQAERTGKPYVLILNKLESDGGLEDLEAKLRSKGLHPSGKIVALPRVGRDDASLFQTRELAPFAALLESFDKGKLLRAGRRSLMKAARERLDALVSMVDDELSIAAGLFRGIESVSNETEERLLKSLKFQLGEETKSKIKNHVRQLLRKYDYLRSPRKWIRNLILFPLDFIGFKRRDADDEEQPFERILHRLPLEPLHDAQAFFQQGIATVIRREAPSSAMYAEMFEAGTFLSREEFQVHCARELGAIDVWIQERFEQVRHGLSRTKKAGIVSASILSGCMLLLLETVVGGGITLLELLLDTAIVPLIPKGVLEVVVYDEIKQIGRDLDERYKRAYKTVLAEQRQRVMDFLMDRFPKGSDSSDLKRAGEWIRARIEEMEFES
ncbi:MAG: hypothetical protein HY788_18515 [Deltaproteobacteria bacterium]|nr:hypothetical protein [Deltaproteobacteria bacterium]